MKTHISLNVSDIEKSVGFYKKMFGIEPVKFYQRAFEAHVVNKGEEVAGTARAKSGYAKFDIEQPPLNLTLNETKFEKGGSLSHLGLQVTSTEEVNKFDERWKNAGLITAEEKEVVCCYAKQDKTWVRDPDGNEWEAFVVLEDVAPVEVAESSCCGPVAVSTKATAAVKENPERAGLGEQNSGNETVGCC